MATANGKQLFAAKTAIVTGAGSGIGEAIALGFAREGARVVLVDIDLPGAQRVAREMRGMRQTPLVCRTDVASLRDVQEMVKTVQEECGPPSILVNNAGLSQKHLPTFDQDPGEWDKVIDVNLKGVLLCSQMVGKTMKEGGGGKIINLASIVGFRGFPQRVAYGPSKAGVVVLTKALAVEWAGYGINVNAVAPGYVRTPVIEKRLKTGEHDLQMLENRIPLGRLAMPAEIAEAVLFLASDRANYITGVTLPVDGGWLARGE